MKPKARKRKPFSYFTSYFSAVNEIQKIFIKAEENNINIIAFMRIGPGSGHALANIASQGILAKNCASLVFRKYPRAQITPIPDLYA